MSNDGEMPGIRVQSSKGGDMKESNIFYIHRYLAYSFCFFQTVQDAVLDLKVTVKEEICHQASLDINLNSLTRQTYDEISKRMSIQFSYFLFHEACQHYKIFNRVNIRIGGLKSSIFQKLRSVSFRLVIYCFY